MTLVGKRNEFSSRFFMFSGSVRDNEISFSFVTPSFMAFFIYSIYTVFSVFSAIMEFSLENLGFVTPSDSAPISSPGSGPPLPTLGSSASSASLPSADEARRQCLKCHRRISKLVYDRHNFYTKCRGFDCSFDSSREECADWSREEMEAYVKHRHSLKAKNIKVKDPLSRPPPPSDDLVPSAQSFVTSGDDVDRLIARLGQELSMSFTRQFEDFKFLFTYFV